MRIAIIGSGISGLSAAWLLSREHDVHLFEKDDRLGGHANTQNVTVDGSNVSVDTGFIVYNNRTYPNLRALFDHLEVSTSASDMSFAVSTRNGLLEYSGTGLSGLFAQPKNVFSPTFWGMLNDVRRFYSYAATDSLQEKNLKVTLGDYLKRERYGSAFINDHLIPMGAAIWSTPAEQMLAFPLSSFVDFCENHGLIQFRNRPRWRTVTAGSAQYVSKLANGISGGVHLNAAIDSIERRPGFVELIHRNGDRQRFDHVVLATHSDQSLKLLQASETGATTAEEELLSAIRYQRNLAVLHTDASLMPKSRKVWSSWNYIESEHQGTKQLCLSYWMNRLQPLPCEKDLFVTLNPEIPPADGSILRSMIYHHPIFDSAAMEAQKQLWSLQGDRRTWFCGAYFGHGFHEDGLQAGLAVAEQLGGVRRPWTVQNESSRIHLPSNSQRGIKQEVAA
ncbi:FAD-dependent oxidoreductase [Rhodobacteraceae bacterium RKSG542]|uniref:NAD(P)/FAD-dependent oxidoreductase n=1 Tax=Pseudovibrio flavus TaxID=2529854 RepID=UPI0012BB6A06|nr:FAD-dependent oxidoreductase [Pseudovibrio flavus]MTI16290.1 FAD-dependent oxidoreductase [Pseudovibrio flavus]